MALGRPRSSLGRCGATIHTAVWDAGYRGRSTSLLVVSNPHGFAVERDARVMQLVFFSLARPASEGYAGAYQGENIARSG
jgi:dUTP pyrophosphatase